METNSSVLKKFRLLLRLKKTFTFKFSNYASSIEDEDGNTISKGAASMKSKQFFEAAPTIEKEVKENPEKLKEIENHPIQNWEQNYFNTLYFKEPIKSETIYAIDITSAYPTTLLDSGLISKKTFEKMQNLKDKIDRLAAVGALAASKEIIHFKNGEISSTDFEKKDTYKVFDYCVKLVDKLMYMCAEKAPDYFLFYWVDCLYFVEPPPNRDEIIGLIEAQNLKVHQKEIKHFSMKKESGTMVINFLEKNYKDIYEEKIFHIPLRIPTNEIEKIKEKYINSKINNNE